MQGKSWTGCQAFARHTHSHTTDLEMTISMKHISLDWGKKPKYPEEMPGMGGIFKLHTHRAEVGIDQLTL